MATVDRATLARKSTFKLSNGRWIAVGIALNTSFRRFIPPLAILALSAACTSSRPSPVAFDGCLVEGAPTGFIIRTAANSIIGDSGAGGPRIRSLAGVPLIVDSVRAHSHVVTDRAVCARLWRALHPDDREPRVAVVQIGRTYWVRTPRAIHAFDDAFRFLTAIVDL
jgi:hypothetical protein